MRVCMPSVVLAVILLSATNHGGNVNTILCEARKSSSGGHGGRSLPSRRSRSGSSSSSKRLSPNSRPSTRRKASMVVDEYDEVTEDEEDQFEFSDQSDDDEDGVSDSQCYDQDIGDDYDDDEYDSFEEERERPTPRRPQSRSTRRVAPAKASSRQPSSRPSRASRSSQISSRSSSRRVAPYANQRPTPSAFSRGLTAIRESIPDPHTLKDTAISSISSAKETTTRISSSLYREVKILSSSELEQAFLKATIPNDSPAKEKHVERLVMITYQVSAGYNIFEVVLRKLWSKMLESDWRTTIKAVYVLHRFGTDGSPQQQMALKTMLREMRRTKDPKRKAKYFNMKQLLEGDTNPTNIMFRAFLARYAHYVLLRVQCFGGMFSEIDPSLQSSSAKSSPSKSKSSSSIPEKPITSTHLKKECLDAAQVVLKAGVACKLKPTEECENTVVAMERVASDMIGLTTAVAGALNSALTNNKDKRVDTALIKLWCEFYSKELLPQTKDMIKRATPTLDAFGIFLPSRMGTTVSQDLLQKGLARTPQLEDADGNGESIQKKEDQESSGNEGIGEEDEGTMDSTGKESTAKSHGDNTTSDGNQNGDNNQVQMGEEEDGSMDEGNTEYDEYEYDDDYYDAELD